MTRPLETDLCTECHKRPAAPGDRLCAGCRAAVEADWRRRYRELAEAVEEPLAALKGDEEEKAS